MSVDEEISIAAIEREMHEQQERLRAARLRLKKKQQQDAHDRAASLKTRLDELDATVDNERGDRMELRATLLRLREAERVEAADGPAAAQRDAVGARRVAVEGARRRDRARRAVVGRQDQRLEGRDGPDEVKREIFERTTTFVF